MSSELKKWSSYAEWPPGVVSTADGKNITEDGHDTEEQADAVCRMLKRDGFGGQGKHFPLCVWTGGPNE